MTADGYPLVGPFDKNYWVPIGFPDGVSSGGGIGKYIADWMVDGEPAPKSCLILTQVKIIIHSLYWKRAKRLTRCIIIGLTLIVMLVRLRIALVAFTVGLRRIKRNGWEISLRLPIMSNCTTYSYWVAQAFDIEEEGMLSTLNREYQMVTNKCGVVDMSWKGKIEVKGC
ncbi:unnamed protein product [Cylicocyclus nassatus]|uniref:Uncharacterized protein n=1 Tax=Cylicocyclus nassatus TaxID=53992 RepID=A0AA36H1G0_CYLNA|nr:unnamed protein product [Cylicocyclus nassatus]